MLTGGPNYMMIRRAIFGKVHGRGVQEIWLISQFPAKHKGVASVVKNTDTWTLTFKTFLAIGKKEGAFKNTKIKCHFKFHFVTVRKLL